MCTIVVMLSVRADYPLVIATNRDEFYARKSAPPTRLLREPSCVGGRDLVGLGTWMGVTETGFFVGVTNQRTLRAADPTKRSRGEVVLRALELGESDKVRAMVEALDAQSYNAFNLMWGTARGLYVAYARDDSARLSVEQVPDGIHVLPNDKLDSPVFFKVARAQALADKAARLPWDACAEALAQLLRDRERASLSAFDDAAESGVLPRELLRDLSALCVKTPSYGTRSSTIVALEQGGVGHYLYADGPPDSAPFVDVRPLFRAAQPPQAP